MHINYFIFFNLVMGQHIDIIAIGDSDTIDIIARFRVRQLRVAVFVFTGSYLAVDLQ